MLSSNNIEELAVGAVQNLIRKSKLLGNYTNEKDKAPVWDGYIYVYNDPSQKKEKLIGRVPVQIKGHVVKKLSEKPPRQMIDISDIDHFLNDFGVLFFHVEIIEETMQTKVFFETFLPYDLVELKKKKKKPDQKQISFNLREYIETQNRSLEYVCKNFLNDRNRQAGTKEVHTLEQLKGIEKLQFSVTARDSDVLGHMVENPFYVYAVDQNETSHPLERLEPCYVTLVVEKPITIDGTEYYDRYAIGHSQEEGDFYSIGNALTQLRDRIVVNLRGTIENRLHDTGFILHLLESKSFNVGARKVTVSLFDKSEQDDLVKKLTRMQEFLRNVKIVSDSIEVAFDGDFEPSKKDAVILDALISSIVYGEKISLFKGPGLYRLELLGKKMVVGFFQDEVVSLYSKSMLEKRLFSVLDENGNHVTISPFAILTCEDIFGIANFDVNIVWESISTSSMNDQTIEYYNNLFLSILKAYDMDPSDDSLYSLALQVSDLLIGFKPDERRILNHLQVLRRKDQLTTENIAEIQAIIHNTTETDILCGAYILLGDRKNALRCLKELDPKVKERFEESPICSLL